jgi:hypothetical protein
VKRTNIFLIILAALLFSPIFSFSATIQVPGDSATIQAGINGAVNGDCMINIFDVTYSIAFLYMDGPAPKVGCE